MDPHSSLTEMKFELKGVQFPSQDAPVKIINSGLSAVVRDASKICGFVAQAQQY